MGARHLEHCGWRECPGSRLLLLVALPLVALPLVRGADGAVPLASAKAPASKNATKVDGIQPKAGLLGEVKVEIHVGLPNKKTWEFTTQNFPHDQFTSDCLAFIDLPRFYTARGVIQDRPAPFLVRAHARMQLPAGKIRLLIRGRNAARLWLDGKLLAETPFHDIPNNGHGVIVRPDISLAPQIRPLPRGDSEKMVEWTSDGANHDLRWEMIVGGRELRPEIGEAGVFWGRAGEDFRVLGTDVLLTDAGWTDFVLRQEQQLIRLNSARRRQARADEDLYWAKRHQQARAQHQQDRRSTGVVDPNLPVQRGIERLVEQKLRAAKITPAPLSSDAAFLRRVSLDVVGTIPNERQIQQFYADPPASRREKLIDRLLDDPGWADHWVGYWQDVLAENPNVVNPTLNNTGPFRWWLHEVFLDNRPMDQWVTELVLMEGSVYFGGPAGFGLATQNDAPMAAKAHILAQAFMGVQLKCARCHDAPYHRFKQADLFGMAAMLQRGPQAVPKTSTIPPDQAAARAARVKVTLTAGAKVQPHWAFPELSAAPRADWLRQSNDSREQLALRMTTSPRFARVIVNRLWHRYLGRGLVDSLDDWENTKPHHSELLDYLAQSLEYEGYNLKKLARAILLSRVYQSVAREWDEVEEKGHLFYAVPKPRRMTAEQLMDSLFVASVQPLDAGAINIDVDGSRTFKQSLNLGEPRRAWQFSSLSNERDRPSLALPFAQPFVTLLEAFGWRGSRQDPVNQRDEEPNVVQPALLAHGELGRRVTRLTDVNGFTTLALTDQPLDRLLDRVYQRLLTRLPTPSERTLFRAQLAPGYTQRVRPRSVNPPPSVRLPRNLVSWSNHLDPEATRIQQELELAVRAGAPLTARLDSDWRERFEDMLWAILNSPEFLYIP